MSEKERGRERERERECVCVCVRVRVRVRVCEFMSVFVCMHDSALARVFARFLFFLSFSKFTKVFMTRNSQIYLNFPAVS